LKKKNDFFYILISYNAWCEPVEFIKKSKYKILWHNNNILITRLLLSTCPLNVGCISIFIMM